jgi:preprotein translocase subunit SecE
MQNQRFILLSFLGAAVLLGMSVQGLAIPLLARLEVPDPQLLGLLNATTLAGLVVGVLTFLLLNRNRAAVAFTNEVIDELRKVHWPDKQETLRSTLVVVVFTFVVAGALAAYDYVWAQVTEMFLFTEG